VAEALKRLLRASGNTPDKDFGAGFGRRLFKAAS
jgi:hypothetical protein